MPRWHIWGYISGTSWYKSMVMVAASGQGWGTSLDASISMFNDSFILNASFFFIFIFHSFTSSSSCQFYIFLFRFSYVSLSSHFPLPPHPKPSPLNRTTEVATSSPSCHSWLFPTYYPASSQCHLWEMTIPWLSIVTRIKPNSPTKASKALCSEHSYFPTLCQSYWSLLSPPCL